jgi:hypothetical protein
VALKVIVSVSAMSLAKVQTLAEPLVPLPSAESLWLMHETALFALFELHHVDFQFSSAAAAAFCFPSFLPSFLCC